MAYHFALEERTQELVPLDWARTQSDLGDALARLGERMGGTRYFNKAVAAWDACLALAATSWPPEWVQTIRSRRDAVQAKITQ